MKYFVERKSAKRLVAKHLSKVQRYSDTGLYVIGTPQVLLALLEHFSSTMDASWMEYLEAKVRQGKSRAHPYSFEVPRKVAEKFPLHKYYNYH